MADIRIGIAGWSYKDWKGIVYPESRKGAPPPVEYLAGFFDLIEINTTFYGHIRPSQGRLWSQQAAAVNPRFRFTAKLNRAFTHSPLAVEESTSAATIRFQEEDVRLAKEGYDALASAGRLGALLLQFPISFRNTAENRDHLERLIRLFAEYPLALEVRHSSWSDEATLKYLAQEGVALCNIDQPLLGRAVRPSEHVTSRIGYVRLHGRRYDQWFDPEKPSDRYDYLYSVEELVSWKGRIESVARKAEITFVVANNHFQGKAPANALELKHMITGEKVNAPQALIDHYPRLAGITKQVESPISRTLFDETH
ncbi:MAG TPA: DUF72 domain-containing protein [Terriglobales bacterium]|nr:DUF72 domain-containing protein [Terriglobales bacterium]